MRKLIIVCVLLLIVVPVFAQDATAIPLPEVTAEPGGGSVVDTVENLQEFGLNLWTVITGVILAFAAGGVTGLGGAVIIINRVKNDQSTMAAIEGLVNSFPPDTRDVLVKIGDGIAVIGSFVKEVSDGVPVGAKPTPPQEPQG